MSDYATKPHATASYSTTDTPEYTVKQQHDADNFSPAVSPAPASDDPMTGTPAPHRMHSSTLHQVVFVLLVSTAQILSQACLAQSIVPSHIIGATFGVANDDGQLSWFPAAYSLTVGTFILIAGRLGDLHGHKAFFMVGFAITAVASMMAGLSSYTTSIAFFDISRALQGVGLAFALPNGIALLGVAFVPGPKKNAAFAWFAGMAPNGFLLGAVFSSLLSQLTTWPWAYYATAIACVCIIIASQFVIPSDLQDLTHDDNGKETRQFDLWGAITGVTGLVLFNFAWNQGAAAGWDLPYVYALLIVGIAFFVLFWHIEQRVAQPLVPRSAFSKHTVPVMLCIALGWANFGIWLYNTCQFLLTLRNNTPLMVTAAFVPVGVSGLCAAAATGIMLSKLQPLAILAVSMASFCTGTILIATTPVDQTFWIQTFLSMVVMPFGMDSSFPAATLMLSNYMPGQQGVAASLINTILNYSVSIGLGIAGTVQLYVSRGGADTLFVLRSGYYCGIAFSACGCLVAVLYLLEQRYYEHVQPTEGHNDMQTQKEAIEVV